MRPISVLYVITDLNLGGVPLHLRRLAIAMRDRGFDPKVVSLAAPGPVLRMIAAEGIAVHDCGGSSGWDVRVIPRLARLMRDLQPDIVHSMLFHANLAARLAAWETSFPPDRLACEIQTVEVERRWHLTVDRWTHRGCRFTVGNSPSVVDHLSAAAGIPTSRLRLVRGGIDPAPYKNALPLSRRVLGVPNGAGIILWTGRLDPVKGLESLLSAFLPITARRDCHLLLAGDGPMRQRLAGQIARYNLSGRVHLLGRRDDVPALLKSADVFAFPSRTEGLPNALLEAMAAGCPIVATDVPGCRDLIRNGDTGLLVPYGKPQALTAAILRLIDDPELARRLGENATAIAEHDWHIDNTMAGYHRLYDDLLSRP